MNKIKVIHCAGSLSEKIGGPAHSVPGLCRSLLDNDIDVTLCRVGDSDRVHLVDGLKNSFVPESRLPVIGYTLAGNMEKEISKYQFDLVHTHCVWHMAGVAAAKAAEKAGVPHIITLRGMLTSWAISHKRIKKQIAWHLYQKKILEKAACIHCTSQDEMDDYRKLGLRNPVAIIPNGVDLPGNLPDNSRQRLDSKWPELEGKKLLVFFSRINPKKGLDMLIDVWERSSARKNNWHLVIAGPDENNYEAELRHQVEIKCLNDSVLFTGALYGEEKALLLTGTDLFILPTYSENFGIAVGEAMAYGKPVITTTGAPWQDIEQYNCGWWVKPTVADISDALEQAIDSCLQELSGMGDRGRGLIAEKYCWKQIAAKMADIYKWLIKDGDKPDYVYL